MSRVVKFKIKRRKEFGKTAIKYMNSTIERLRNETFDGSLILAFRREKEGIRFFSVFLGLTEVELIEVLSWFIMKYPEIYNASITNLLLKASNVADRIMCKGDGNGSVV